MREGLASRLGAMRFRLYGLAQLADALTRKGKHSAGLGAAREGLETEERTALCCTDPRPEDCNFSRPARERHCRWQDLSNLRNGGRSFG